MLLASDCQNRNSFARHRNLVRWIADWDWRVVVEVYHGAVLGVFSYDECVNETDDDSRARVYVIDDGAVLYSVWIFAIHSGCSDFWAQQIAKRLQKRSQYAQFIHEKEETRFVKEKYNF